MIEHLETPPAELVTPSIYLRWLYKQDFTRFTDLDRSEIVGTSYKVQGGQLQSFSVDWDVPNFIPEGDGDHTVAEQIAFCQSHLDRGGRMIGAFDDETLVGVGLLTPEVRPGLAQLAYLHVSSGYRREGIATRIMLALFDWACCDGAKQIYVSAIPTESAVGFYQHAGFVPVAEPLPELFEIEPDDIHMVKSL